MKRKRYISLFEDTTQKFFIKNKKAKLAIIMIEAIKQLDHYNWEYEDIIPNPQIDSEFYDWDNILKYIDIDEDEDLDNISESDISMAEKMLQGEYKKILQEELEFFSKKLYSEKEKWLKNKKINEIHKIKDNYYAYYIINNIGFHLLLKSPSKKEKEEAKKIDMKSLNLSTLNKVEQKKIEDELLLNIKTKWIKDKFREYYKDLFSEREDYFSRKQDINFY